MSTPAQLRIAARIHYTLKQDLGEGIDVAAMLTQPEEAREVLFVCQASGNAELISLARQFVSAGKAVPKQDKPAAFKAHAPQDAAWSRNSSGFGITRPADLPEPMVEKSWRSATQWLRRASR